VKALLAAPERYTILRFVKFANLSLYGMPHRTLAGAAGDWPTHDVAQVHRCFEAWQKMSFKCASLIY